MAENQTASEDSGQQQQQDQQTNNQPSQQQDSSPDQESSSDSFTPNPRSKTSNMRNSLTCIKLPRPVTSTCVSVDGSTFINPGKHHLQNHNHLHNHNSTSSGHQEHHVIHRTTSESLRLGSEYSGNGGGGSLPNSTSNSSSIREASSSLAATTTKSSNSTTSNHSQSMSSSSSPSLSSLPHSHPNLPNCEDVQIQRKPKTSSFQITSVTVGSKLSSDNGDDSADDLDESHTDDNSRITDLENETPSVSEDTFSKEDLIFASNALSTTAPIIPTSTQIDLVVVDPIVSSVGQPLQNVQTNVAENVINVVNAVENKKKPEVKETQHRSERFKVVKIESTEPFRRGRWMCMDYLDHSANQSINKNLDSERSSSGSMRKAISGMSSYVRGEETFRGSIKTNTILTKDSKAAASTGGIRNNYDAAAKLAADGNLNIYRSEPKARAAGIGQNLKQSTVQAQTIGGSLNLQPQQTLQQSQLPNQFQGLNYDGNSGHGQTMPMAASVYHQAAPQVNGNETLPVAGQSQPASFYANQVNAPATVAPVVVNSAPPTFQQPQSAPVHGVTLPANIQLQNRVEVPTVTGFPNASYVGGVLPQATSLPQACPLPQASSLPQACPLPQASSLPPASSLPQASSLPPQQTNQVNIAQGQTMPMAASEFQQYQAVQNTQQPLINGAPPVAGQSQPVGFFANPVNAPATVGVVVSSAPPSFQQPQSTPVHGATLPANMHLQSTAGTANVTGFPNVSYVPVAAVAAAPAAVAPPAAAAPPANALPIQQTGPQSYPVYCPPTVAGPQTYAGAALSGAGFPISVNQQIATDSNAATPPGVVSVQQPQSQPPQQFQPIQSNPVAGQSMPIINQVNYIQGQLPPPQLQQPSQVAAISSPATINDPTVIAAAIQPQQMVGASSNPIINQTDGMCVNANGVVVGSIPRSSVPIQHQVPVASPMSVPVSVVPVVQGSQSVGNVAVASTISSTSDDNQLHHVSETETESASSLALANENRSKRKSSISKPPILPSNFNLNESTESLSNIKDNTAAYADATERENLFTNIALGDERYMLSNRESPSDEAIESIGKNTNMRSLPIPIGGPSGGGLYSRQTSDYAMARSASPTSFQYSPFYYGSPNSPESLPISMSYDPTYGCASTRLNVPTLMSHGPHGAISGGKNRLIRVIDGCGRSGIDKHDGQTSAATPAGGSTSVLNR